MVGAIPLAEFLVKIILELAPELSRVARINALNFMRCDEFRHNQGGTTLLRPCCILQQGLFNLFE